MPKNPTREERLEWHMEHQANCSCRPVPDSLAAEIAAFKRRASPK